MSPERWELVCEIFHAVCALRGDELERELAARCAGDAELRRAVLDLLASSDDAELELARLAARSGIASPDTEEMLHTAGRVVGNYRVLKLLGRGGMGVVYLAERADGMYDKQVALKLLPLGLGTAEARDRFERERAILGQLEHSGITRLVDGGVTDEGTPYFVMDYIAGEPLRHYCERRGAGLSERLALFEQVCSAVDYAHRHLVVHRDIKASNILVTAEGEAKLLDFGVAKLLDPSQADDQTATLPDRRYISPAYAAPELLRGSPVTTACDVYALGMVLYELLAERSPWDGGPRYPADWLERVTVHRLEPPSRRCISDAGRARAVAGDLDTITLKALSPEPARRYPSVSALQQDLARFRSGRPVEARPESLRYRVGKYLARHRAGVAMSALFVLALIGGFAATAWQAHVASAERDRARVEAQKLAAAQEYLIGLFEAADPAESLGEAITAEQLVAHGVERLGELATQPEVKLEMLKVLSRVQNALGHYAGARDLADRWLELAMRLHGPGHAEVAAAHAALGLYYGHLDERELAQKHIEKAIVLHRQSGDREALAAALDELGMVLYRRGAADKARDAFEEALGIRRWIYDEPHPDLATSLNNYGLALRGWGEYEKAKAVLNESLAIYTNHHGRNHPRTTEVLLNLAGVLRLLGRMEDAERAYREVVAIEREILGEEHPSFATTLNNLAVFLRDRGDNAQAAELFRRVLRLDRMHLGEEHRYVAITSYNLARSLAELGEHQKALNILDDACPIIERNLGKSHLHYAACLRTVGITLYYQTRYREARRRLEEAVNIYRQAVGESHPELALGLSSLARAQLANGALDSAESSFREALAIQKQALPSGHPDRVEPHTGLTWVLLASDRAAQARPLARRAMEIAESSLTDQHWRLAETRAAVAAIQRRTGSSNGAKRLKQAHAALVQKRGTAHPVTRLAARYVDQ